MIKYCPVCNGRFYAGGKFANSPTKCCSSKCSIIYTMLNNPELFKSTYPDEYNKYINRKNNFNKNLEKLNNEKYKIIDEYSLKESIDIDDVDDDDIHDLWYNSIKDSAANRNLDFEVTQKYLEKLMRIQKYKCRYSGVKIYLPKLNCKEGSEQTASLDRIDSRFGYIKGNVIWCHKFINIMKGSMSLPLFVSLCTLISHNNKYTLKESNLIFKNTKFKHNSSIKRLSTDKFR